MRTIILKEDQYWQLAYEAKVPKVKRGAVKLKEDNNVTANLPSANGVQDAIQKARKIQATQPVGNVEGPCSDVDASSDRGTGEGMKLEIPSNATGSDLAAADRFVKQQDNGNAHLVITKPTVNGVPQGGTNESIDRLRRNSIEFTKKEFSDFLKTL